MNDDLMTMEEMLKRSKEREQATILFNDEERFFQLLPDGEPINYDSVSTYKSLLECVYMISEKSRFNIKHICYLIKGISERLKLDLDVFVD